MFSPIVECFNSCTKGEKYGDIFFLLWQRIDYFSILGLLCSLKVESRDYSSMLLKQL